MSYVAPSLLDFALPFADSYTPPNYNAVHFNLLADITIDADAPLQFVASIQALGAVYAIGSAILSPQTVIEANAPPAGPTAGVIAFSANGQGASGQPATADATLAFTAAAIGKVAYFGAGTGVLSIASNGVAGVGVGGTVGALLIFDTLAEGSTDESYWGEVNATFPLAAYAVGNIPQEEVCA